MDRCRVWGVLTFSDCEQEAAMQEIADISQKHEFGREFTGSVFD